MTLAELVKECNFEVVVLPDPEREVENAYCSDLLSDVVAHCPDEALLITVQNHNNSIAVCTLVGSPAILLVHNREVSDEMKSLAERENIAILRTSDDQFTAVLCVNDVLC